MAFLGAKQVLPDEIKIRDLAEQISLKSAQADPKVRPPSIVKWACACSGDGAVTTCYLGTELILSCIVEQ